MRLVSLQMRRSVSINGIVHLNVDIIVQKGVFWTIGEYSYFCLTYSCILSKDKNFEGSKHLYEIMGVKITLMVSVE